MGKPADVWEAIDDDFLFAVKELNSSYDSKETSFYRLLYIPIMVT